MIIITAMLALAMEYHFGYAGVVYAFGFALCSEVAYFFLIYWYMQKSEQKQRDSYFDIVAAYKVRLEGNSTEEKKLEGELNVSVKDKTDLDKQVVKLAKAKKSNEKLIKQQQEIIEKQTLEIEEFKAIELEKTK